MILDYTDCTLDISSKTIFKKWVKSVGKNKGSIRYYIKDTNLYFTENLNDTNITFNAYHNNEPKIIAVFANGVIIGTEQHHLCLLKYKISKINSKIKPKLGKFELLNPRSIFRNDQKRQMFSCQGRSYP